MCWKFEKGIFHFTSTLTNPVRLLLPPVQLCTHAFLCRSKQSCEDGWGSATIKIISPLPSEVSLRSRLEPGEGLADLLLAVTSLQYDFKRLSKKVVKQNIRGSTQSSTCWWPYFNNPPERRALMNTGEHCRSVSISCNRDSTHYWAQSVLCVFCNSCNQKILRKVKEHWCGICNDVMVTLWKDETTVETELARACRRMISRGCVYSLDHISTNMSKCWGII